MYQLLQCEVATSNFILQPWIVRSSLLRTIYCVFQWRWKTNNAICFALLSCFADKLNCFRAVMQMCHIKHVTALMMLNAALASSQCGVSYRSKETIPRHMTLVSQRDLGYISGTSTKTYFKTSRPWTEWGEQVFYTVSYKIVWYINFV